MIAEWSEMSASDFVGVIGRYRGGKELRRVEDEGVMREAVAKLNLINQKAVT
jgi:hypothetical protein